MSARKGRRLLNKTIAWLAADGAALIFPAKGLQRSAQHGDGMHQVDVIAFYRAGWCRLVESTSRGNHARARRYLRELSRKAGFAWDSRVVPTVVSWRDRVPEPCVEVVEV